MEDRYRKTEEYNIILDTQAESKIQEANCKRFLVKRKVRRNYEEKGNRDTNNKNNLRDVQRNSLYKKDRKGYVCTMFWTKKVLKQKCLLNPILFSIYISDLEE